jgi:hypothetical protein
MSIILNLIIKHAMQAPEEGKQSMTTFEAWDEFLIVKVVCIACSL